MAAALKDPVIGFHRIGHGAAFGNGERKRFFTVNVLTRACRFDYGNRMPVIRHGDQKGIDILARNHLAEIFVSGAAFVHAGPLVASIVPLHLRPRRIAPRECSIPIPGSHAVHVAHGNNLHALVAKKIQHVPGALVAGSNHSHGDPVARRHGPLAAQGRRRNEKWSGC